MENEKEIQLCKKRIMELATTSYYKEYPTYTDFLTLNEQSVFQSMVRDLPAVSYTMWGGNAISERKMICFSNSEIDKVTFPISVLKIQVVHAKFAEKLTHRDYLGAVLHLGIDRSKIGDIMFDDKDAYIFVADGMKDYIMTSLEKVKHTNIRCEEVETDIAFEQNYQEIVGTVSSVRLDAVIATAFHSSRSRLLSMISGGKVFVNGRLIMSNSYRLNEGDIVSVRGVGKFLYDKEQDMTKKGKVKILLKKYT